MRAGIDASSPHRLDAFKSSGTGRHDPSRLPRDHQIGPTCIIHSSEERDEYRHRFPRISEVSFAAALQPLFWWILVTKSAGEDCQRCGARTQVYGTPTVS